MTTILFADQCAYMRAYFQHELEDEGYRLGLPPTQRREPAMAVAGCASA